ncbi:MAG TPA: bifunctional riboflavin kinase/FMN adenylyltransferase [Phycisphaerales bacterium]|nr:bifunctional riboflavin kinase/FMN adenylyltransferase [Phycisphaerales bacterium]
MPSPTAIVIGNFDGVHIGHAELIRRARALAAQRSGSATSRVIAMVFFPHPMTVINPSAAPPMLMAVERREELLLSLGADEVVRLEPSKELLSQSPDEFLKDVFERFDPCAIVEGQDFRFGRARSGDVRLLRSVCSSRGAHAEVVEPVTVALSDQSIVIASSSMTRWLVENGRVDDAARILGRPHELTGTVVRGDRRGRELGFPTANLQTQCLPPRDGVYGGRAVLPDGSRLLAAIHVGARATFDDPIRTIEAHLLDWPGTAAVGGIEYGWPLRLELVSFVRDQARFHSVDDLVRQIERDVERVRSLDRSFGPVQEVTV